MKNKLTVRIHNKDYTLMSDETKEYTDRLALALDSRMKAMLKKAPSLSVTDAAALTALDCMDELAKANQNIENIRTQIKDYVDDAAKSRQKYEEAQREIRTLKEKNARLEEELKKASEAAKAAERTSAEKTSQPAPKTAEPASKASSPKQNGNFVGTVNYDPNIKNGGKQ